ncbi:MltB [Desulfamplus magnetovallimortis]|uniref:MltB n=1 Tax=Desulfamplus magnetovallimortis TaxID=1246637 RepID=A0A1W1HG78_9BACT|nr:lytic murein transglycosylase [Desulfamplus magnetovallimortis]SLM31484.1 MltB [Desulfamplus magnetovallimortis]
MGKNINTHNCRLLIPRFLMITIMTITLFIAPFDGVYCKKALAEDTDFNDLKNRLAKDGFDIQTINSIYDKPSVLFETKGVSLFFVHSEGKLDYDQFLSKKSINSAKQYLKSHAGDLENAQKIYGVDKTIITAIILVETRLGTYIGNRKVINTLSTMAALSDPAKREILWRSLPDDRKMEKSAFEKKADKKSAWAYEELKALLRFTSKEGVDPVSIKGSYAGAMGISQFMPSNVLTLAKDGNGDGKIDLFTHADAIHSIANYLKNYGWEPSINRQKAHKVLYQYNHSNFYVDTLLKISDRLKD